MFGELDREEHVTDNRLRRKAAKAEAFSAIDF